jgi:hypothetical protein
MAFNEFIGLTKLIGLKKLECLEVWRPESHEFLEVASNNPVNRINRHASASPCHLLTLHPPAINYEL